MQRSLGKELQVPLGLELRQQAEHLAEMELEQSMLERQQGLEELEELVLLGFLVEELAVVARAEHRTLALAVELQELAVRVAQVEVA